MGDFLIDINSIITCPHGGKISLSTANNKVSSNNMGLVLQSDIGTITGCPFTLPNGKPQPCVTLQWTTFSTKVKIMGGAPILKINTGICKSAEQIPQGPPNITSTQMKVRGI